MRTLLLIVVTVVVVGLLGGLYVWMQSPPPAMQQVNNAPASQPVVRTPPPTTSPTDSFLQGGQDIWARVYDEHTGNLAWQVRSAQSEPQPDGSVNLTHPQAEFYTQDGRVVTMDASHGHVVMPSDAAKNSQMSGRTPTPSRGELYDVVITMYPSMTEREHPSLVCQVNNVSFDNDTLRIATESFTQPDGTVVPADQVPVKVRGDYDVDGKGLTIRWNERDRQLQMLQIAHGEQMTIKSTEQPSPQPTPTPQPRNSVPRGNTPSAARAANRPATNPTTHPHLPPPVYRATFDGGVQITQAEQLIAKGDKMGVDFVMGSSPTGNPTTAPARQAAPAGRRSARGPATQAVPATRPQTTPEPPTVIRWPGKLVVVPIEIDPPKLLPGQQTVEMSSESEPVILNHSGSEIHCASFNYSGADDSLILRSSPSVPMITMKGSDGMDLTTPSLKYNGSDKHATLEGPSHMKFPMHNDQTGADEILDARWTDSCVMIMTGPSRDQLTLQHADFAGDVKIDHPKLNLTSKTLSADFAQAAPPTGPEKKGGTPPLKQIDARGDVVCTMTQADQKVQHISSQSLIMTTAPGADGKLSPHTLVADGQVHSLFDDKELNAGHLMAMLTPSTQPTDPPHIQSLVAQHDVTFKFSKTTGTASYLELTGDPDGTNFDLKLIDQPSATVVMDQSTLTGGIIQYQTRSQLLNVTGPGTLNGVQQLDRSQGASKVNVTWNSGLEFDGAKNTARADGQVVFKTIAASSSITGNSDRLLIEMMDDPNATTNPATQAAATQPGDINPFGNKVVRGLTFDGNAWMERDSFGLDQAPLRSTQLFAPLVRVEPQTNRFIVPSAGRMLDEDLKSPTTKPANGAATTSLGEMSGSTAFRWAKQLIFDQTTHSAEMSGDVMIVHETPATNPDQWFQLEAQKVTAMLDATAAPTSQPTTAPSNDRLRRLLAEGAVNFTSTRIQFTADNLDLDPEHDLLSASGTEGIPVQIYDATGTGAVQHASWNTRTQQIVDVKDLQARIRR